MSLILSTAFYSRHFSSLFSCPRLYTHPQQDGRVEAWNTDPVCRFRGWGPICRFYAIYTWKTNCYPIYIYQVPSTQITEYVPPTKSQSIPSTPRSPTTAALFYSSTSATASRSPILGELPHLAGHPEGRGNWALPYSS
jgi:hypothetical protein